MQTFMGKKLPVKWVAVDPGISGTGVAVFRRGTLLDAWNIYPRKEHGYNGSWPERCSQIVTAIHTQNIARRFRKVYIEWPSQFTGLKGLAAANSNDILKLACLIGRLAEYFIREHRAQVVLVPVQTWKGNLPKDVMKRRVEKFFGKNITSHAADAAGIGKFIIEQGE